MKIKKVNKMKIEDCAEALQKALQREGGWASRRSREILAQLKMLSEKHKTK